MTAKRLDFAYETSFEQVLTNPTLDAAAALWEEGRYKAFQLFYRSMRIIDDIVDDFRCSPTKDSVSAANDIRIMLCEWLERIRSGAANSQFDTDFLEAIQVFRVPLWPWERLVNAMIFDLSHSEFATFREFLKYSEGASVAPASVFVHLCGVGGTGSIYSVPEFDVHRAARPLAVFCYLTHILRDFVKDQERDLNYFPRDLVEAQDLNSTELRRLAREKSTDTRLTNLIVRYASIADRYGSRARLELDRIGRHLDKPYRLSLDVIHALYNELLERVDRQHICNPSRPVTISSQEARQRIHQIIGELDS